FPTKSNPTNDITSTRVSINSNSINTGEQTTVTATVTDTTSNTNPTGSVTFDDGTPSAGGSFGETTCNPSGNNQLVCTATYTASSTTGSVSITANYPASPNFAPSSTVPSLAV